MIIVRGRVDPNSCRSAILVDGRGDGQGEGRLEGFSSDRLFRFLNALDQEIEIVIRQSRKRSQPAGIRVLVPA